MIYTSAWGFQRCSVRLLGRCESLQSVDRAQNWLHVFSVYAKPETINSRKGAHRHRNNWYETNTIIAFGATPNVFARTT